MTGKRRTIPKVCDTCRWWRTLSGIRKELVVCKNARGEEYLVATGPDDGCEDWAKRRPAGPCD
ncbi:MAG TPA: hypothetical protein VM238_22835 [Phycisphaerae bacterium]|nr:hypothetical protein [Phycisphaerae bacterium]